MIKFQRNSSLRSSNILSRGQRGQVGECSPLFSLFQSRGSVKFSPAPLPPSKASAATVTKPTGIIAKVVSSSPSLELWERGREGGREGGEGGTDYMRPTKLGYC